LSNLRSYVLDKAVDIALYIVIDSLSFYLSYHAFSLSSLPPDQLLLVFAAIGILALVVTYVVAVPIHRRIEKTRVPATMPVTPPAQVVSRLEAVEPSPLAQKMRIIADTFKPIMIGTSNLAIKNIALDLLSTRGVDVLLGKGVEGWRLYFTDYGGEASLSFNRIVNKLAKFIQEPQNEINFQDLVINFKDWMNMHYNLLHRFHLMLRDIEVKNMPKSTEDRYRLFRAQYNLFISKLLDIVDDLEKHGAVLRGTVYLELIEELEQRFEFVFPPRYA
jgi:hypothetical protein